MKKVQIQRFDTGMGKIDALLITEPSLTEKGARTSYVEVYEEGDRNPESMLAWFGTVESFTRWISGAEVRDF